MYVCSPVDFLGSSHLKPACARLASCEFAAFLLASVSMASSTQELLRESWLGGRATNLSALSEARAWALREVWRDDGKAEYALNQNCDPKTSKARTFTGL